MKRTITILLLLAMALALLTGCGGASGEQTAEMLEQSAAPASIQPAAPETVQTAAHDWSEPNAVDDSFRFQFEWRVSCDCDGGYEHFIREELPAYVNRWVDGGEILDSEFMGIDCVTFGWVCFSGTPKQELGWKTTEFEGKPCFCRGFFLRCDENDGKAQYTVSKTIAMEPIKRLKGMEFVEETGELLILPKQLPTLSSAELYVAQLGQSFVLTDPDALRGLEKALSKPEFENLLVQEQPAMAWIQKQDGFLPLYLHYADGSCSLAFAPGDGSDCCSVWDSDFSVFGPVSLFERFGVPLPSPGYTHNADGTTTIEEVVEGTDTSLQLANRHEFRYTFDADGRLVRFEHFFHREDNDFDESTTRTYSYYPDGKLERVEEHGEGAQGTSFDTLNTYSYNDLGQITRFTSNNMNNESQGMYYDYHYDEQNRLTAIIYHYRDGREGLPSGNSYFWYDEHGLRHSYGVDQDGHLVGGPEDDEGDHPVRR